MSKGKMIIIILDVTLTCFWSGGVHRRNPCHIFLLSVRRACGSGSWTIVEILGIFHCLYSPIPRARSIFFFE